MAVLAAVFSSFKNKIVPRNWIFFGEIGLSGEMRPVQYAVERVQEAIKHGYKKIFLPSSNQAGLKDLKDKSTIVFFSHVSELISFIASYEHEQYEVVSSSSS
jgi:DNA repair protein RadA/Sms